MPSNSSHPNQTDFALVTINHSEDQAVRDVFEEYNPSKNQFAGNRGIFSWWHTKDSLESDQFIVVHASAGDAKGPLPAIELIRELDRRFQPRFLLVLGTAGGINERGFEYGRVVYSRQVHAGYQQLLDLPAESGKPCKVDMRLYDDPLQPPSDRLYLHAKKAAVGWQPTSFMQKLAKEAKAAMEARAAEFIAVTSSANETGCLPAWAENVGKSFEKTSAQPPEATEIFSGPYLIDGQNSELFSSLKRTFPKVGAVEMEAGAVAQAVLHSIETERFVGYLIIKGISDVVDSDVPAVHRATVRKVFGRFASVASAEFAKRMIETWKGNTGHLYGRMSLVPPKYSAVLIQELRDKRHSNSVVYEGVHLDRYSQILHRLCIQESGIKSAWTFCYLAPYRFFAALDGSEDTDSGQQYSLEAARRVLNQYKGNEKLLQKELLRKFPHFQVFADLAKANPDQVVRVMHRGRKWDEENKEFLPYFECVNTNLLCHVLSDHDLEGEDWVRSDQVVLNDELLFDFDGGTKRLVVTYLDPNDLGTDFLRFKEHCKKKSRIENRFDYLAGLSKGKS